MSRHYRFGRSIVLVACTLVALAGSGVFAQSRPQTGDQHRDYTFPPTGESMPYRVYVPTKWDGESALPILLFLHGAGADENSYMDMADGLVPRLAEEHGYIVVSPLGFTPLGAYGNPLRLPAVFGESEAAAAQRAAVTPERRRELALSELEVMTVLEIVTEEYGADRSRTFLAGHSMGSGGAWHLAARYPERWRAVAPMSGPFIDAETYPFDVIRDLPILMTEGTGAEPSLEGSRALNAFMSHGDFDFEYLEVDGNHGSMVPMVWPRVFEFFDEVSAGFVGEPSGTGPFPATAETRTELPEHTVYRPVEWPSEALPLYVWGNGGCSSNGLAHAAYLRQIASLGYVIVALGIPGGGAPAPADGSADATQASQMVEAIDWATRETARQGSDFFGRIDVSRIAVGGHSCGGLQALAVSDDPRVDTTLVLNSGIYIVPGSGRSRVAIDKTQLPRLHGPALYLSGGPGDIAHENAIDDVERIDHVPVFFGALNVGHGGTFAEPDGGEWARVSARWLDWQLKGDADASWDFAGADCRLCNDERWTVQQKQLPAPTGPLRESVYVPVRDGTRLAMHLLRPARDGVLLDAPQPIVFAFTPYRARYRTAAGRISGPSVAGAADAALLDAGYALAIADIRGKGASFGARRGFQDRTEARDGYDLVQWLASRPWSNGNVGMYGCSYLGGSALHVATTAPPALKAIFAGATDLDKFAFVRKGGVTAQFNTRPDEPLSDDLMSVPLDEDLDGSLLRAAVAEHADNTPMAPLWYGMPFRDSVSKLTGNRYWQEVGPYTYLDTLRESGIATYFWSNWRDEPTAQMILAAENLDSRLLLGPGSHCAQPPDFDFAEEIVSYFDEHLRDEPPALPPARVTWWLDGVADGDNWQHGARWPGIDASRQTWYLAEDAGELSFGAKRSRSAEAGFVVDYDPGGGEYFAFWVDSQHGRGLSFTSEALDREQELVGYAVVHLSVSSDYAEPVLFAYLESLAPDGAVDVLAFGRLAAAYRRTGSAPYDALGLPWHTGLESDYAPLRSGETAELSFALTPTSQVIPAGHRLRLVVTGADPRQRNLEAIRVEPAPRISLALGGRSGSRVELPLQAR